MPDATNDGNCFICGKTLPRNAVKGHIVKEHSKGTEECLLIRFDAGNKFYWLYADASKDRTLTEVDMFLRGIWLECCGHLSSFSTADNPRFPHSTRLAGLKTGDKLIYDYDMGSTTTVNVSVIGETKRVPQKKCVRLIVRNAPYSFVCASCKKPAEYVCHECVSYGKDPYLCKRCARKHEHEYIAEITNSPRSGICGYDGALDTYFFDPKKY